MGYLIIFNVAAAAAAQFVGPCLHCTGLFQPSNSYYRAKPRPDGDERMINASILVGRGQKRPTAYIPYRPPKNPFEATNIRKKCANECRAAHCREVSPPLPPARSHSLTDSHMCGGGETHTNHGR